MAIKALLVDRYHKTNTLQIKFSGNIAGFLPSGFQHLGARRVCITFSHGNRSLSPAIFYLNENRAEQPTGGAEQEHTGVSQSEAQQAEGSRAADSAAAPGYSVRAGNFKTKLR